MLSGKHSFGSIMASVIFSQWIGVRQGFSQLFPVDRMHILQIKQLAA